MDRDNRCMYLAHVCFMSVVVILLMLVEDTSGDYMEEAYSRAGLITAL